MQNVITRPKIKNCIMTVITHHRKTQKDVLVASEWKINVNEALKLFWWIIFPSFNRGENETIDVLSSEFWIQIVDLKQLPGL